jgi:hypothetical protein
MIERIVYLKPALQRLIAFDAALSPFSLNDEEWKLLDRILKVLEIFLSPTLHLSGSKYPTLHLQLPYYSMLLASLHKLSASEEYDIVGTACAEAWELLNDYWCKTDQQTALVISLLLDTRFKEEGLRRLGWTQQYVNQAKRHLNRVYSQIYKIELDPEEVQACSQDNPLAELLGLGTDQRGSASTLSESDRWLREPRENISGVDWWRLNHTRYPGGLGNMPRDYLAIPASSVPAERLFSSAGMYIAIPCNGSRATRPISRVDNRLSSGKGEIEDRV